MDRGERRAAYAGLLLVMACFGGTWPAGKVAAAHVPPATVATCRFAVAAALLWLWARLSGRPVPRPAPRDLPLVAVLGLTVVFAYNLFFLYGVRHAPATDGSVLVPGLIPLVTTVLAWPVLGERPTRRTALGLAVALAGLALVADPVGGIGSERLVGEALFVGAAFSWSAYTLVGRAAISRFGSVNANVYATAGGALLLSPLSLLGGGWGRLAAAPVQAWASIGYLALVGTVLAFVVFYEGVRVIGAGPASAFALLVPIFGVLSSVLVLGERLRPLLALGGAIVLAGLWIVQSPSPRRPRPAEGEAGEHGKEAAAPVR